MSRIQKAYEARLYWLLQQVGTRKLQKGLAWWLFRAQKLASETGISQASALTKCFEKISSKPRIAKRSPAAHADRFFCDAGLGGLARWLRAAGYEACWESGIDDDELIARARAVSAVLLTTDSMLMERRLIRQRIIPAFWLPPTLTIPEQLANVFREFSLTPRPPRCMSCGGELKPVEKETFRGTIPPKTFCWLDDFFQCNACQHLFWHGTHWQRIRETIQRVKAQAARQ